MKNIELYSPAKINLFLDIFGKRSDGYHDIMTVFEKIDLCDTILLSALPDDKIILVSDSKDMPQDETNLAYKAAIILKEAYGVSAGVKINIKKKIPVAAGLGGGSSNAATVLKGLNELWKLTLGEDELWGIAKRIGADVPFFIFNYSFALGLGRGDEISPIKSSLEMWHLIITPPKEVLTKDVYNDISLNLTGQRPDVKMIIHAIRKSDLKGIKNGLHNTLEPVVAKKVTDISLVKDFFKKMGFDAAKVTGSGPTIFVLTDNRKEAEILEKEFSKSLEKDAKDGWGIFVAKTLRD
ncbi:MAG: 4-(cytidine 5'-diphospho)-2-C-methyl-D-erythritol kinase [Candidatus Omnitrophica bacterium]|nr:4-(cytidine 5'-diphospho)-2-C-methyl-D-erythritol kinase [Candidatus Omnitrophota bacterium]MBU4487743.1 4-(cytidine 5'-diphospho)-2-C-methyl-D-erythritol kinase [Candidatus Omnitrophota bacterium]MCG2705283.1 4-(cytidine 5'-diphospho)-2-C-methyl-D-erythritol kinase [Candidatus Omnitrophota bacterium]